LIYCDLISDRMIKVIRPLNIR